ncbi:MAG: cytochrome c peroxidase [Pseudomonadota bacterium]
MGGKLFFDVNLSPNHTQECSTCHHPSFAFANPRGIASIGDKGDIAYTAETQAIVTFEQTARSSLCHG